MKGVVLAAGKGTRLYPLTKCIPKVLLPVYDVPMIHFALDFMKRSKVDEVAIVISREDEVLMKRFWKMDLIMDSKSSTLFKRNLMVRQARLKLLHLLQRMKMFYCIMEIMSC